MPDFHILEKLKMIINASLLENPYFINISSGIVSGIFSGVISGIIVGIVLLYIQRKINKKDKDIENLEKITISNKLIEQLNPGINYKKAKEILGEPSKTYDDYSIFEHEDVSYKSDLYIMSNGLLKITTLDKESVYALTVFLYNNIDIKIPFYEFFNGDIEPKIVSDFILNSSNFKEIRTMRDYAFAIQSGLGNPFYKHLTLFTCNIYDDSDNIDLQNYVGKHIDGFCLSDDSDAFYIYDYESR